MATVNPRINVTFEANAIELFNEIAETEHKSVASVVKELALEALERREDKALSAIATHRDVPSAKRVKHADAWK